MIVIKDELQDKPEKSKDISTKKEDNPKDTSTKKETNPKEKTFYETHMIMRSITIPK
jgi:sortase (surface protein transpeptidase)